jgi:hypothetical protein
MAEDKNIKKILFRFKKQGILTMAKWMRYSKRRLVSKQPITLQNSFNVPIIINNFNRYTYLLKLISWLESKGYTNIVILDNNSTYSPLLNYYSITKHKVVLLKKNVGYKALWETDVFKVFEKGYYVYTDPDVLPDVDCPGDIVFKLYQVLNSYTSIEKCGPALRIDNLPDSYSKKQEVQKWESEHWLKQVETGVFDAPLDTTFALYKPFAKGEAEICKAYRLAGKYCFLHLPWYEDSSKVSEEDVYYTNNMDKKQSHWVK